ncbi:dipeptide ABC transporter ATP-binding protein [Cellulomonas hominis]|uniref:dipeptide ABC transporter ATP-binding protein n=1 Tax=Cellulomonas hominis TaxID=156981 RepID=UPI0014441C15|nr:ABC transporter ATP-binding protein [Cellulomonas hominis]NKY10091.1 ABC transporter ATP-binding protein [Cellulomonas hominis]
MSALLTVRDLRVAAGGRELVHGLDLTIGRGERVGLIGESGSGKSVSCLALMGLLPDGLAATGSVELAGEGELLGRGARAWSRLHGDRMSMVFQEPMTALNPLMRVGDQVAEVVDLHRPAGAGRRGAPGSAARAVELLAGVGLPDPARAARAYPHQLSGGQRQRVMLAMAMANTPDLLLADEPTTALDATVQAQVLDLMQAQVRESGTSLLFITHDLGVVQSLCDRVVIMRHGEVVESGSIDRVFSAPEHAYTRGLLAAAALRTDPGTGRLVTVLDVASGTTRAPDLREPRSAGRGAVAAGPVAGPHEVAPEDGASLVFNRAPAGQAPAPLLAATELTRTYVRSRGPLGRSSTLAALRGVSFDVRPGQRFGIVGESGCGKSTLLRLLTGLDRATSGSVTVEGREITGQSDARLRWLRSDVQIVFQDPMGSLDPRMRVRDIVTEPLRGVPRDERDARAAELMADVDLPVSALDRYPHQFSGGQRQRIAIARALSVRPRVLVADEAVSALDVSVRAQVLNLLQDLVAEHDLTLVFVSHDLHVVRHACDTVAVMNAGRIVECGPTEAVFADARHPYTTALLRAAPRIEAA